MSKIRQKINELKSQLLFEDFIFMDTDGRILDYDEEGMISYLLDEDVLFCNSRKYIDLDGKETPSTIVLFVNCSDIWSWACSDAEEIDTEELPELCERYMIDKKWGIVKWACQKRNMRPQKPIRDDMKKEGVWCKMMENLSPNYDEKEKK